MDKIQDREGIANLPVTELEDALKEFLAPVAAQLPDVRLRRVLGQAVQGIVDRIRCCSRTPRPRPNQ